MRLGSKCNIAETAILLLGLSLSWAGCDSVKRHKILSFFFDGVPPLGSQEAPAGQNSASSTRRQDTTGASEPEEKVWFVHEPRKICTNCHEQRNTQQGSLSLARLTAPVPELCFGCHADFGESEPFVHGPVAVGECLFCHEHHKSKIAGLLKKKEPDLCYQCHEAVESALIPGHPPEPIQQCTQCHDPHGSSNLMLLRE